MAIAYALVPLITNEGTYKPGDKLEVPDSTDREKAHLDGLLRINVITLDEPAKSGTAKGRTTK